MKNSPDDQRLEDNLKSHTISGPGFLGHDTRRLAEIIDTDAAALAATGKNRGQIVARMRELTQAAREGLETRVRIDGRTEAVMIDSRGRIPCPWPHPGSYRKSVVTVTRTDTGQTVRWSELNIHMIEQHGFFEGKGSFFRIDPEELVEVIFAD